MTNAEIKTMSNYEIGHSPVTGEYFVSGMDGVFYGDFLTKAEAQRKVRELTAIKRATRPPEETKSRRHS